MSRPPPSHTKENQPPSNFNPNCDTALVAYITTALVHWENMYWSSGIALILYWHCTCTEIVVRVQNLCNAAIIVVIINIAHFTKNYVCGRTTFQHICHICWSCALKTSHVSTISTQCPNFPQTYNICTIANSGNLPGFEAQESVRCVLPQGQSGSCAAIREGGSGFPRDSSAHTSLF